MPHFYGDMAELVDAPDLDSGAFGRGGSTPSIPTILSGCSLGGKVLDLESRERGFESHHPDHDTEGWQSGNAAVSKTVGPITAP